MPLDTKEKLRIQMNLSRTEANIVEMQLKVMELEEKAQTFKDAISKQEQIKAEYLEKLGE